MSGSSLSRIRRNLYGQLSCHLLSLKHKENVLSATRKLVERKAAAAHGRSDALEEAVRKVKVNVTLALLSTTSTTSICKQLKDSSPI